MTDIPLKVAVHYQVTKTQLQDAAHRAIRDDRGEMGSWMILAAGLAVAAAAAVGALSGWFGEKTTAITNN